MFSWAVIKPISLTIFKEFGSTMIILFIIAFATFLLVFHSPNEDMLYEYLLMISEDMPDGELDLENMKFSSAFFLWISAVLTGNFGISINNGMPALEQSFEYLRNSVYLISFCILLSLMIALPFAALIVKKNHALLQKLLSFSLTCLSYFPIFWLAYVVIFVSGNYFDYFPLVQATESDDKTAFLLPVILLAISSGLIIEISHNISHEVRRVCQEDYILCARAKGASVFKHVFKEGIAFPLLTLLSNRIAYLFGATIIIEQIFNWPGIGRLLWQSTQNRDIPLLLSAVLLTALVIRIAQFLSRVCYILINPRASHE